MLRVNEIKKNAMIATLQAFGLEKIAISHNFIENALYNAAERGAKNERFLNFRNRMLELENRMVANAHNPPAHDPMNPMRSPMSLLKRNNGIADQIHHARSVATYIPTT